MKVIRIVVVMALAAMVGAAADLATKKALTLEVAKGVAAAAEKHGAGKGWKVAIAILDDGGNLVYLQRDDGVMIGAIELAMRKADTAVNFKRPSVVFAERLSDGAAGMVGLPGAIPFPGGVPLEHEGELIGAIGVSGVTGAQDEEVARAGAASLPKVLGK